MFFHLFIFLRGLVRWGGWVFDLLNVNVTAVTADNGALKDATSTNPCECAYACFDCWRVTQIPNRCERAEMQVISTISRITVHLLVLSIATADSSVNPQTPSDRLESTTATSGANGTTTGTPRKAGHALVNFVIIFADDVGYGDMGLTCGMRESAPWLCPRTPVLDNLARSNHTVFFERFYTAASACSPARAALLTGRNNRRSCIDHVLPCSHDSWACSSGLGISDKEFSIAHAVKLVKDRNSNASMYMTQLLGKWFVVRNAGCLL